MQPKTSIPHQPDRDHAPRTAPGKPPFLRPAQLTQEEMARLLRTFTQRKTEVREEDVVTLVQWAQAMRTGAVLLDRVLDGALRPVVREGVVTVEALASAGPPR